jgi:hypothetical protein
MILMYIVGGLPYSLLIAGIGATLIYMNVCTKLARYIC